MRRISLFLAVVLLLTVVLTACGPKTPEQPVVEGPVITEANSIKAGSFNILNAQGGTTLDAIAAQIKECDLDVIGLQEVDYFTERANIDTMKELADRLGYYYIFVPAINHRGGEYGDGVLSRWPITSVSYVDLPYIRERRTIQKCVITTDWGYTFNFYNTHLDTQRAPILESLPVISDVLEAPFILTGDFNIDAGEQLAAIGYNRVVSAARGGDSAYSFITYSGGSCIDNVHASATDFTMTDEVAYRSEVSDHYMTYATVYAEATLLADKSPANLGKRLNVTIKNEETGKFLAAAAGSADLKVEAEGASGNQTWELVQYTNNIYTMKNIGADMTLTVETQEGQNGANLVLSNDPNKTAAKFYLYKFDGQYVIKPINLTGKAVMQLNQDSMALTTYTGEANQLFAVTMVR